MGIKDRDYMRRPPGPVDWEPEKPAPEPRPEQKLEMFLMKNWKVFALVGLVIVAIVVVAVMSSSPR